MSLQILSKNDKKFFWRKIWMQCSLFHEFQIEADFDGLHMKIESMHSFFAQKTFQVCIQFIRKTVRVALCRILMALRSHEQ